MTALKELIKWWNEEFPNWDKSSEGYSIIEKAKGFLEKEKQQIADAYECGVADGEKGIAYKNGEEFYKDNYEL